jgi:transcription elongation factor S-II
MNKHKMFKPNEMYKLTCEIENSLSTHYSQDKTSYEKRIKCIISNMHANSDFINKLLLGQIEISNLAIMNPEEFLSQETRQIMLKKKEDAFKSRRTDWNTLMNPGVAGIYRCGKCKCNRTTSYQVQIRRADEPMTTFITCMDCNHSWRQ